MASNIENREIVIESLKRELIGPSPDGKELQTGILPIVFNKNEDAYGPFIEQGTGEEILLRDPPTKRYGVGVLFPFGSENKQEEKVSGEEGISLGVADVDVQSVAPIDKNGEVNISETENKINKVINTLRGEDFSNDFDLSLANSYHQSSIGISCLVELPKNTKLVVSAKCGRYREIPVIIEGAERKWWVRSTVELNIELDSNDILTKPLNSIKSSKENSKNAEELDLRIEVYSRPGFGASNTRLITICLVNRTDENESKTSAILFQSNFRLSLIGDQQNYLIFPYPRPPFTSLDDEEKSLELLYKESMTYAIGHGCAANWGPILNERVEWVSTECLPVFETPSITPDITNRYGKPITASMYSLAGFDQNPLNFEVLEEIVKSYEDWINQKEAAIQNIASELQPVARRHLSSCRNCAKRMWQGIEFLRSTPLALRAFQLANRAILLQQLHSRPGIRKANYDEKAKRIVFSEDYTEPDIKNISSGRGSWRAFQIAFLLMSLRSSVDPNDTDRETVELIWFPTGGGKTEAYLGLTAFSLFYRRMVNNNDNGTHVII